MASITAPVPPSSNQDLGQPQFASHKWVEPIPQPESQSLGLLDQDKLEPFDEHELSDSSSDDLTKASKYPPKKRQCCGVVFKTPNSSRFANHRHSRFIQKFPFLLEMFYWAFNYTIYVSAKGLGELIFSTDGMWELAEKHGIAVLTFEHESPFSFLFPPREVAFQQFFLNGRQAMLSFLNRNYSWVHIPATISFLTWYYYAAPTHAHFAAVRRMMTLTNILSFAIFTAWPCMPPRLLPKEYGFFDTVRQDSAQSVWATGKFFNQLAAFPSLHFGYAFCVGVTMLYHSGIFRRRLGRREKRLSRFWQVFYLVAGVAYPGFVLTIIVATANHYWLDALAAAFVVGFSWLCNRVFLVLLPLEDLFLFCLRLEKPEPTTGRSK
ncbi:integral membrane protein [Ophiostoma piceae UAMH 11346]|uniref:Integral membrane protein n=1 Tax=Ophiostoma piceae (strain UAMH 11346) TaxID=1262450 RepID=S3C1L3_OPHP1|nr:integral membrane protein [Ophiostoma piceae UAMH 11346]